MNRQRVYIATSLAELAEAIDRGYLPESDERFVAPTGDEESEYDALIAAAEASAGLTGGVGRRAVAVADLADPDGPVAMELVDAVLVELREPGAGADERGEPDAAGDDPSEPADDEPELAWFAHQEIPHLLELLGGE